MYEKCINQTYQTNSSKPNLLDQTDQTKPNQNYWLKQSMPGSAVPLEMFYKTCVLQKPPRQIAFDWVAQRASVFIPS